MPPDITPGKAEEEQLNMKPGFMTSVCPSLSMAELVDTARRYGYEGIEFRTEWDHAHGLELDSTKEKRKECRSMLADGGLEASCVATSVRFNTEDKSARGKQQDTLKSYIELAADIGAPYIRTFGDPMEIFLAFDQKRVSLHTRILVRLPGRKSVKASMEEERPTWNEGDFFGEKFGH